MAYINKLDQIKDAKKVEKNNLKFLQKYFTNSKNNGMIKSLNSRDSTAVISKKDSYFINSKYVIFI